MKRFHEFGERLFKDKNGNVAIWQTPNVPLMGWIIFKILSMAVSAGTVKDGFENLGTASLFIWAYLEIKSGASYFRRLLGAIVMTALVTGYFRRSIS